MLGSVGRTAWRVGIIFEKSSVGQNLKILPATNGPMRVITQSLYNAIVICHIVIDCLSTIPYGYTFSLASVLVNGGDLACW